MTETNTEERVPLIESIEGNLYTPDNYLIDLGLLKDFRVGALAVLLNRHQKGQFYYNEFMRNLLYYQNREFHEICTYVDNCPITEEDIDNLLQDEKEHDIIYWCSPSTCVVNTLFSSIIYNVNHSAVKEKWGKVQIGTKTYLKADRITFHINTYPLKLSKQALFGTLKQIAETFKVDVKFIHKAPMSYTQEEYNLYDDMYLLDCRSMLECEWFVEKPPLLIPPARKFLKSPPVLSRDWKGKYPASKVKKLFETVKAAFSLYLEIDWLSVKAYSLDDTLYDEDVVKIDEENENVNTEQSMG